MFIWGYPTSIEELKQIVRNNANIRFVGGNTDLFAKDESDDPQILNFVHLGRVAELRIAEKTGKDAEVQGFVLGASLTITEVIFRLEKLIESENKSEGENKIFVEVIKLMKQFGSEQIRNVAVR